MIDANKDPKWGMQNDYPQVREGTSVLPAGVGGQRNAFNLHRGIKPVTCQVTGSTKGNLLVRGAAAILIMVDMIVVAMVDMMMVVAMVDMLDGRRMVDMMMVMVVS